MSEEETCFLSPSVDVEIVQLKITRWQHRKIKSQPFLAPQTGVFKINSKSFQLIIKIS